MAFNLNETLREHVYWHQLNSDARMIEALEADLHEGRLRPHSNEEEIARMVREPEMTPEWIEHDRKLREGKDIRKCPKTRWNEPCAARST